jgi:hypothetical protein
MADSGARTGPVLIGLAGKAGAGKNWIAERLRVLNYQDWYNKPEAYKQTYPTCRSYVGSFAKRLKDTCSVMFNIERGLFDTTDGKASMTKHRWPERFNKGGFMSVREIMQVFGTDIVRDQWDQQFWINATIDDVKRSTADLYIIADVRFANEEKAVREAGGTTVRIVGREYCGVPQHASEAMEFDTMAVIDNSPDRDFIELDRALQTVLAFAKSRV